MSRTLTSFINVCAIIQHEKTQRHVMNPNSKSGGETMKSSANTINFNPNHQSSQINSSIKSNGGKGKGGVEIPSFTALNCNKDGCWEFHPHLRQNKDKALGTKSGAPNFGTDLQASPGQIALQLQQLMVSSNVTPSSYEQPWGTLLTTLVMLLPNLQLQKIILLLILEQLIICAAHLNGLKISVTYLITHLYL